MILLQDKKTGDVYGLDIGQDYNDLLARGFIPDLQVVVDMQPSLEHSWDVVAKGWKAPKVGIIKTILNFFRGRFKK